MRKRIAVGLAMILVLTLSGLPAAGQEGDGATDQQDDGARRVRRLDAGEEGAGETSPGTGETAETQKTGDSQQQTTDGGPAGLGRWTLPVLLLGVLVLMYVWMGRSRKKQEQKRKEMIAQLKKGDKIMSIGGVLGTVIEAKPDELVVKVDEANNVRMRFARWAVRAVGEEAQSEASKDNPQG
jgi:preprotein translocase subunit YajC